jgi:hypothetical protein
MVTVAVGALELEYLVEILYRGRGRESVHFYRLRLHPKFLPTPTPTPQSCLRQRREITGMSHEGRIVLGSD